jgi:hypothetical protein
MTKFDDFRQNFNKIPLFEMFTFYPIYYAGAWPETGENIFGKCFRCMLSKNGIFKKKKLTMMLKSTLKKILSFFYHFEKKLGMEK